MENTPKQIDEDVMLNMKGAINVVMPLMIASFVLYLGAIFIKNNGALSMAELLQKIFSIFTLG